MKTQKIRWSGLCAGLCMLIGAACADSANSSSTTVDTKGMTLEKFYKDSVYLCIEGDVREPEIIWGNKDIYKQAFRRMHRHAYIKDNQLYFEFHSAKEIRISQNLFDYINRITQSMNIDAKEKNLKLFFDERSGTYILDWTKSRKNIQKNTKAGNIVLKNGKHLDNFIQLMQLINNPPQPFHLNNAIDFANSDFRGNSMGDVSISGEFDPTQYIEAPPGYYALAGYYCCNACAWKPSNSCSLNEVLQSDFSPGPPVDYEYFRNADRLPLITIRNGFYYGAFGY